ncbi:MAG: BtpA/SgcQ family protein [Archaeoglobaceae archaeon]|nr:BtpA/SgcQ family protein [Archaeoglobaceae archaeon]MDW8118457.1 BtpA/SgcQ family protein [Archaeoglobaceae archaeon]
MEKTVICVIHLKPLPGAPLYENFEEVLESALKDAKAIEEGGADSVIVENYGDKPFLKHVGKETVACMSVIAWEIKKATNLSLGINVLRNDAFSALAIAKAVKADFIRVNQLFFPSTAPEGFLFPEAGEIMRYRRAIDCKALIFADLSVKHAVHFVNLEDYFLNAERSLADAFIMTGKATGMEVNVEDLKLARKYLKAPIIAGSGINEQNAKEIAKHCDGVIVGSYIKSGGKVDVERVKKVVSAVRST